MESEDGHVFIKNLAQFIRTHEQALASAFQSHQRGKTTSGASSSTSSLTDVLSRPFASFASTIKPSKLCLTPHHLYYLLTKFEELGVNVGSLTVRLENIHAETPGNYVSFLGQAPKRSRRSAETDSLRSVSSVRSVISNVSSSIWSSFRSSSREEKRGTQLRDDMKYLYSCFTKIPALRLAPDPRTRLVAGFEEFPFDTAVPVFVFKNLSSLEISDLDFRQIYGWDALSRQLRSLTVRRGQVEDPLDILVDVVLDDIDKRRRRSSRAPVPTTPSTQCGSWMTSPKAKHAELAYSSSGPTSPFPRLRTGSLVDLRSTVVGSPRQRSPSPARPHSGSAAVSTHDLGGGRRSSSHDSSIRKTASRQKSVDLITFTILPTSAWQFLRHLSLTDNGLYHVSASSLAPVASTLQSLDLSHNLFKEIPESLATLSQLRALKLSNCLIESLRSLIRNPLPAITALNLHGNRIESLAGIERLYPLEKLDLRDNRLHDPAELARLTGIPYMSHVYVTRNPFTKTHPEYRVTIFNLFRRTPGRTDDVVIDHISPMYSEKRKLVDWTPELPVVAVIRPKIEDETPEAPTSDQQLTHDAQNSDSPDINTAEAATPRKKSSRMRVVQLDEQQRLDLDNSRSSPVAVNDIPARPSLDPEQQHTTPANEAHTYQLKLSALKADFGKDWLNHVHADHDTPMSNRPIDMRRELSLGSRTLG